MGWRAQRARHGAAHSTSAGRYGRSGACAGPGCYGVLSCAVARWAGRLKRSARMDRAGRAALQAPGETGWSAGLVHLGPRLPGGARAACRLRQACQRCARVAGGLGAPAQQDVRGLQAAHTAPGQPLPGLGFRGWRSGSLPGCTQQPPKQDADRELCVPARLLRASACSAKSWHAPGKPSTNLGSGASGQRGQQYGQRLRACMRHPAKTAVWPVWPAGLGGT